MKRIYMMIVGLVACVTMSAQQYQELWITGSAVPGGVQKLIKVSDNDFKYAGRLLAGELRISTTKKIRKGTVCLVPNQIDANIVNKGIGYSESSDIKNAAWQVVVSEDRYRFHIDTDKKELNGELFQPWGELFLAGGATEVGWKSEGKMILMKQSLDNPCVWTWEGELKRHPEVEEPASFKFQGQDRWHPKAIHPYVQGADILKDKRFRTGGSDTKWTLSCDGRYRIKVDLFNETVQAELVK
jgi:hypothetical protein